MKPEAVLTYLQSLGAFKKGHTGRKLGDHLMGTYDLLKGAGCREDICLAGAFHSIYGSNAFRSQSIEPTDKNRKLMRMLIGDKAERLAFLFSIIDRPKGIESGRPQDWRTTMPMSITQGELHDLRIIEAANLLEQGEGLDKYPLIAAAGAKLRRPLNG